MVVFRRGQAFMLLPGEEGFTLSHGKSAKQLPLVAAPSGHLVIPCDDFASAPASRDASNGETFVIDYTSSTAAASKDAMPTSTTSPSESEAEPATLHAQPTFAPL